MAHFGIDLHMAAGLLDEAIDHRETEARALAHRLGRDEGLEDPLQHLGRHATPVSVTASITYCPGSTSG